MLSTTYAVFPYYDLPMLHLKVMTHNILKNPFVSYDKGILCMPVYVTHKVLNIKY